MRENCEASCFASPAMTNKASQFVGRAGDPSKRESLVRWESTGMSCGPGSSESCEDF